MKIHELVKSKGLKDKQRRRWRGNATGTGNYSGRGLKGQKSRSGHSMKPFFEWGQTSIVQRIPKARGFTRYYKLVKDVAIVNLGALDADDRISDTMEISKEVLKTLGYISSVSKIVKILGQGDYAKHLTFKDIDTFSASAKVKLENPGTTHSVAKKAPAKVAKKVSVAKPVAKKVVEPKAAPSSEDTQEKKVAAKPAAKKPAAKPAAKKAPAKPAVKKTK